MEVTTHGKYLGLPTNYDKSKKFSFASICYRVWHKLQSWKEILLSRAGKEVLINAVVQAIPTLAMSSFKLPTTLCNDINSMITRFWWGIPKDKKGICWMSWEFMCGSKRHGVLDFCDFEYLTRLSACSNFKSYVITLTLGGVVLGVLGTYWRK